MPKQNPTSPPTEDALARYAQAFASLEPATMDGLVALLDDAVHFTDPFNDVRGKAAFRAIFDHMFATCTAPRFHILDTALSKDDAGRAYLRWRMSGRLAKWPHTDLGFEGMSEIHIGTDGRIKAHHDHWDSASQLLANLPVIGALLRPVLRLFEIRPAGK